jgi:hypothetical protein
MSSNNGHQELSYELDGEVIQPDHLDLSTLAIINKSEIDQQVATAKKWPRSIKKFRDEALQLATLDEATAAECIYALPRDGKVIEGPSARFAEILAYSWGNSRAGARVIGEDGEFVTSQGMYFDLEKNVAISYEVKRRITTKTGKRYSADMIGTTSNAASSIALRNAVLKGVPKAIWKPIYDAARKVVAGDFKTLVSRRDSALAAFVIYGVTPDMIFKTLGISGKEDIGLDHLVILSGFLTALKENESSVEDIFGNPDNNIKSAKAGAATTQTVKDIADKYAKPAEGQSPNPQTTPAENAQPQASTPEPESQPTPKQGRQGQKAQGVPLDFAK